MSKYPKIILYVCTKQINFLRNLSEGHFRTPSLSWYSFSDPKMTRVARLCKGSILLMCPTRYGFQTWQSYSKIGRTRVLYAVETPSDLFWPKVRLSNLISFSTDIVYMEIRKDSRLQPDTKALVVIYCW